MLHSQKSISPWYFASSSLVKWQLEIKLDLTSHFQFDIVAFLASSFSILVRIAAGTGLALLNTLTLSQLQI